MTSPRLVRSVLALGLLAAAGVGLSACGGSTSLSIILYNGQHQQTANALITGFEKATGITVNVRTGDEDELADSIVNEGAHSPADVIFTENSPALEFLQNKGLLSAVDPSTLARTPAPYDSPHGDWVGISARVSVLIYNPSLISLAQLPTSVLQLADSKYRGKLAFSATETDFQPIITSVLRTYGEARTLSWLEGIRANAGGNLYPDNETIADEVNRGQVAFGVVNQYYWYRLRAEIGAANVHSKITYFAPHDPGYVVDISGAAILAASTHQSADQKFLAYLVSPAGQAIIASSNSFEYPIATPATPVRDETPFDQLQPNNITIAQLGDGSTAITLLQRAGFL